MTNLSRSDEGKSLCMRSLGTCTCLIGCCADQVTCRGGKKKETHRKARETGDSVVRDKEKKSMGNREKDDYCELE